MHFFAKQVNWPGGKGENTREGEGRSRVKRGTGKSRVRKGRKIGAEIVSPFLSDLTFSPSLRQQYVMRKITVETEKDCLFVAFVVYFFLVFVCLFSYVFAAASVFQ